MGGRAASPTDSPDRLRIDCGSLLKGHPQPTAPRNDAAAHTEAVERLLHRRQLQLLPGHVVVRHEPLRLKPRPSADEPQWHYHVAVEGDPPGQTFTTFLQAVTRAEDLAVTRRARIMFVEDDVAALLADYRRQT